MDGTEESGGNASSGGRGFPSGDLSETAESCIGQFNRTEIERGSVCALCVCYLKQKTQSCCQATAAAALAVVVVSAVVSAATLPPSVPARGVCVRASV